jgi:hypothetical protein
MNYPIIKTDNYLLVVDESEIKVGDFIYHKRHEFSRIKKCEEIVGKSIVIDKGESSCWIDYSKKIIYHLPLNNAPTLEGVPLLPPLEDEVEKLAFDYTSVSQSHRRGFIDGYNKAKEKYNKAKYPVAFESTIGVCSKWLAEQCDNNCCGKPEKIITITNSQGLTQLVGKYIY